MLSRALQACPQAAGCDWTLSAETEDSGQSGSGTLDVVLAEHQAKPGAGAVQA
jgi:hypothetical protein